MKTHKAVKKLLKLGITDIEIIDETIWATIDEKIDISFLSSIWKTFSSYYTCEVISGNGNLLLTLKSY